MPYAGYAARVGDMAMSARQRLTQIMNQPRKHPKKLQKLRQYQSAKQWNIVKGDTVAVINKWHKDYLNQGKVLVVQRYNNRVIVEGINLKTKFERGDPERGIKARQFKIERSLPYSDVNLVCPVTKRPTRVYRKVLEDGTKVRIAKRSGAVIEKPGRPPTTAASQVVTESCTSEEDAWEVTWEYHGVDDPFRVY